MKILNGIMSMMYIYRLTIIHTTLCPSNLLTDYRNGHKWLALIFSCMEYPLRNSKSI